VPVIVPAAWWAMALPAREVAHAALGSRSGRLGRITVGAAALTAWDLFLDPQMTAEGYWRWARRGRYRGIPLSNYAGWLVTGAAVMAVLDVVLAPAEADVALVAEYAAMAVMETVGFAAFFGDRLVAATGGAATLPLAAAAVARLTRRTP
jgi:putative membrane protein